MNELLKASLIGGCYATTLTFGLAASVRYHVQTPKTLSHTVEQIQQAVVTGQQPEISLGEVRRHPFSPLFLLMAIASGTVGSLLVLSWVWGVDLPQIEQSSFPQFPSRYTPLSLPESRPLNFQSPLNSLQTAYNQPVNNEPSQGNDPRSLPFEQRRQWLWQLLAKETPWFLQLLEATPILFYGQQRAGKSQPALALLIARRLFLSHEWEIVSPHGHLENWFEIGQIIPLYGSSNDYIAINQRIDSYYQRVKNNDNLPYSVLWDELTRYKDNCDSEELLLSFLSESQKSNQFPILVSHGNTSNLLGGTKGTCEAIRQGVVQLYILGQRGETGRIQPTGRATVIGLTKDAKGEPDSFPVKIPTWLQGNQFLSWFPELQESVTVQSKSSQSDTINNLNKLWSIEALTPPHEQPIIQLSPQLQAIWNYAKKRGETISARDVQRANIKDLLGLSADEIRERFKELETYRLGWFDGTNFTPTQNVE